MTNTPRVFHSLRGFFCLEFNMPNRAVLGWVVEVLHPRPIPGGNAKIRWGLPSGERAAAGAAGAGGAAQAVGAGADGPATEGFQAEGLIEQRGRGLL